MRISGEGDGAERSVDCTRDAPLAPAGACTSVLGPVAVASGTAGCIAGMVGVTAGEIAVFSGGVSIAMIGGAVPVVPTAATRDDLRVASPTGAFTLFFRAGFGASTGTPIASLKSFPSSCISLRMRAIFSSRCAGVV
jgi:hypothetical protein